MNTNEARELALKMSAIFSDDESVNMGTYDALANAAMLLIDPSLAKTTIAELKRQFGDDAEVGKIIAALRERYGL